MGSPGWCQNQVRGTCPAAYMLSFWAADSQRRVDTRMGSPGYAHLSLGTATAMLYSLSVARVLVIASQVMVTIWSTA